MHAFCVVGGAWCAYACMCACGGPGCRCRAGCRARCRCPLPPFLEPQKNRQLLDLLDLLKSVVQYQSHVLQLATSAVFLAVLPALGSLFPLPCACVSSVVTAPTPPPAPHPPNPPNHAKRAHVGKQPGKAAPQKADCCMAMGAFPACHDCGTASLPTSLASSGSGRSSQFLDGGSRFSLSSSLGLAAAHVPRVPSLVFDIDLEVRTPSSFSFASRL